LFQEPISTSGDALIFGCALHLIGSITQLISVVLEQLLMCQVAAIASGVILTPSRPHCANPRLAVYGQSHQATWLPVARGNGAFLDAAYRDGTVLSLTSWIA
jgi:hypothetical protein